MEFPGATTKQWLVILALLSSTASTLMKPTGPNLKYDLAENFEFFSPIYPVLKILWLFVAVFSYRFSRIMSTRLILWLSLTLYCHWRACEVDPRNHMKHSSSVVLGRRVLLVGITLPAFVAMMWLDDHRSIQLFVACSVGDAVASELLTTFSLPSPGTIYFRKDWPKKVLLGSGSGAKEITSEIECQNLTPGEGVAQDDDMELERSEDEVEGESAGGTQKEASDENKEKEMFAENKDSKQDKPKRLRSENLCDRVKRLSDSLLGTDAEADANREYTSNDICTMFKHFYPRYVTWTCGHWDCFIYRSGSLLSRIIMLIRSYGAGIIVSWLLVIDIKLFLPIAHSMLLNHPHLHNMFFILYETIFVSFGAVGIPIITRRIGVRNPGLRSIFDGIVDSLARRTGLSTARVKGFLISLFITWPLQFYLYFYNPVPMPESMFWGVLSFLILVAVTVPTWLIAGRIINRGTSLVASGEHDAPADQKSMGEVELFKKKANMSISLLFPTVAGLFLWSRF